MCARPVINVPSPAELFGRRACCGQHTKIASGGKAHTAGRFSVSGSATTPLAAPTRSPPHATSAAQTVRSSPSRRAAAAHSCAFSRAAAASATLLRSRSHRVLQLALQAAQRGLAVAAAPGIELCKMGRVCDCGLFCGRQSRVATFQRCKILHESADRSFHRTATAKTCAATSSACRLVRWTEWRDGPAAQAVIWKRVLAAQVIRTQRRFGRPRGPW